VCPAALGVDAERIVRAEAVQRHEVQDHHATITNGKR
jgi:hypothetical protein